MQLSYVIVGRGAWAVRMQAILEGLGRRYTFMDGARQLPGEPAAAYVSRLTRLFTNASAEFVWLCVPPGPHVVSMVEAAIGARLHTIVEKPWMCSEPETQSLASAARAAHVTLGVHFEYCLLERIEDWRLRFEHAGPEARFSGRFAVPRPDRHNLPALLNLGSHLLAMRRYAVPACAIGRISCAYDAPAERYALLEFPEGEPARIDFNDNREPIIQRFLHAFESAAADGERFPFDLDFALNVSADAAKLRAQQTTE